MKEKTEMILIQRINGVDIYAVKDETGKEFVPVKPVCQAIGVQHARQIQKLQEHHIYRSTVYTKYTVGADGKDREMVCIDAEYVYGWLLGINPDNVSEQARPKLIEYQLECHHALHAYFHGRAQRQQHVIDMERALLNEKKELDETLSGLIKSVSEVKAKIKSIDGKFAELQSERLNPTPSLFD